MITKSLLVPGLAFLSLLVTSFSLSAQTDFPVGFLKQQIAEDKSAGLTPNQTRLDVAITKENFLFNQNLNQKNEYYTISSNGKAHFFQNTLVSVPVEFTEIGYNIFTSSFTISYQGCPVERDFCC